MIGNVIMPICDCAIETAVFLCSLLTGGDGPPPVGSAGYHGPSVLSTLPTR